MGFFDKLKKGLAKTKNAITAQMDSLFKSFVAIDEDMLEEIEEILIASDVGAVTASPACIANRDLVIGDCDFGVGFAVKEERRQHKRKITGTADLHHHAVIGHGIFAVNTLSIRKAAGNLRRSEVIAGF